MEGSPWLGLALGLAVIALHAAARGLTHRLAVQASGRRTFLLFELGGLGARMMIVFGAVTVVLLYVPVHVKLFVGTVLVLLVLSMGVEIWLIWHRVESGTLEP